MLRSFFSSAGKTKSSPYIVLFVGILAVSSASLFIRLAQKEAPSLVIAAFRMSLAALLTLPFCIRPFLAEMHNAERKTKWLLVLSGVFLAFHFASWITSLEYTSITSSVVLVTTAPLWVALFSPLFLNEKVTKWVLAGLAISLLGSVVVGVSSSCSIQNTRLACESLGQSFHGRAMLGNGLALAGAFLSAGYLIVGRKVREKVSLSSYIFSVYSLSAIVLVILVVISGEKISGFSANVYLWMVALALVPQIIGHSAFNWALKYLSAAYVSIALLGEPVGTVLLSMIFLRESPALLEVIGGLLILFGIVAATRSQNKHIESD